MCCVFLTRRSDFTETGAHPERLGKLAPDLIAGQPQIPKGRVIQPGEVPVLATDFHALQEPGAAEVEDHLAVDEIGKVVAVGSPTDGAPIIPVSAISPAPSVFWPAGVSHRPDASAVTLPPPHPRARRITTDQPQLTQVLERIAAKEGKSG